MSLYIILIFVIAVPLSYSEDSVKAVKNVEDDFIKSGSFTKQGQKKPKNEWETLFANWTEDRQGALCERALNYSCGKDLPEIVEKSVTFKIEKHAKVKAKVLKCPSTSKYLFESRRETDCYLIMGEEKPKGKKNDTSIIFIEKEVCQIGLM